MWNYNGRELNANNRMMVQAIKIARMDLGSE
jgi:hypothetical protein